MRACWNSPRGCRDDGRAFTFAEGAETKGNERKTTGSYYTPDSLVQALLDSALDPVLDRVESEAEDPAEALLGVTRHRSGLRLRPLPAGRRPPHRHACRPCPFRRRRFGRGLPPRLARRGPLMHLRRGPQPDGGRADQGRALD